jgi:hypothetical protein
VESVVVLFPSGTTRTLTGVASRQTLTVTEDMTTAVLVSILSAVANAEGARVSWILGDAESPIATVYRRLESSGWEIAASVPVDASGRVEYLDRTVAPGNRYAYRLGVTSSGREHVMGEVWVDVPGAETIRLEWLGGNPLRDRIRLALTSPAGGDANLMILDVSGRALLTHHVPGLARGRQELDLGSASALRPGVYWMRMRLGSYEQTVRAIVMH